MNKLALSLILFIGVINHTNAQYDFHKVDITVGVLAPVLGYPLINVDYSLTDSYSVGVQVTKNINGDKYSDSSLSYGDFSISPSIKYYTSDNEAKGFFVEGFVKYKTMKYEEGNSSLTGAGLGVGYKKVTSYGLVLGLDTCVGYGFISNGNAKTDVIGKGSLFIGWRL